MSCKMNFTFENGSRFDHCLAWSRIGYADIAHETHVVLKTDIAIDDEACALQQRRG